MLYVPDPWDKMILVHEISKVERLSLFYRVNGSLEEKYNFDFYVLTLYNVFGDQINHASISIKFYFYFYIIRLFYSIDSL